MLKHHQWNSETSSLHQVQPAACEHQHSDCDLQIHLNHSSFNAEHSSPLSVSLLWTSLAPDWRGEQRLQLHKQPYNQVYASQTVCIYGIVSSLWSSHSTIYLCIKIHVRASCRLFPSLETGWEGVCVCDEFQAGRVWCMESWRNRKSAGQSLNLFQRKKIITESAPLPETNQSLHHF